MNFERERKRIITKLIEDATSEERTKIEKARREGRALRRLLETWIKFGKSLRGCHKADYGMGGYQEREQYPLVTSSENTNLAESKTTVGGRSRTHE